MPAKTITHSFLKSEKYIFLLLLFIHLLPLLTQTYFVTLDGPAHLYNANLIRHAVSGHSDFIKSVFSFNTTPEPNWSGHFLLGIFLCFLPAWLAEKAVLVLYVVMLPVSFRTLVKQINPESVWLGFLVFPFIYNMPFCFGFFNFSLGLPLLFFGMTYWIKNEKFDVRKGVFFTGLVVLCYFSHLFVCLVLLAITGGHLMMNLIFSLNRHQDGFSYYKSKIMGWGVIFLPVLVLVMQFIVTGGTGGFRGKIEQIPFHELTDYLKLTRTLVCWDYESESRISVYMGIVMLALAGFVIYPRITNKHFSFFRFHDFWLMMSLIMIVLFFVIPNNLFSGGFISVRLLLFGHLFFILWLALHDTHRFAAFAAVVGALAVSLSLLFVHNQISSGLNNDAKEYTEVVSAIPEKTIVLPLNYSDNWLHTNLSNYAGALKNIIVLDNYEAAYPQFPLKWQPSAYPYKLIGNYASSKRPCIRLMPYETASGLKIEYIVRWCYQPSYDDSCSLVTNDIIQKQFDFVYASSGKRAELFKRKQ